MSETGSQDELAREAGELAGLVVGREPPETAAGLRGLRDRVLAGRLPSRRSWRSSSRCAAATAMS